jgi:isochorismate synthase
MDYNRELLLEAIREGSRRAAALNRSILVSVAQPAEPRDLIQLFVAAQSLKPDNLFYWEHTTDGSALLGIESTATIQVAGSDCFAEASTAWRRLFQDGVMCSSQKGVSSGEDGPLLFGGFAFDPLNSRSPLWAGFPDGLLLLPAILIRNQASGTTLHLQTIIRPNDNIEQAIDEIVARLRRLEEIYQQENTFRQPVSGSSSQVSVQDGLPALEWMKLVKRAANQIRQGHYRKVVLARSIHAISTPANFSIGAILQRLRASHPGAYRFAIQRGERCFVGATPEQLARVQHGAIQTMALAGSAPHSATKESDARLGSAFLWSAKNREEHAIVVEMICEALARVCSDVSAATAPQALKLKNIQHLQTPIQGTLQPGVTILDALAALHPTPAVGGLPSQAAREMIRSSEQLDRGWYAGPIGWIDKHGNGEFAVALRSALVHSNEATLFAGCGIVAGSDPMTEYAESCLKFQTMLAALNDDLAGAATWLPFVNTMNLEPTLIER